MWFEAVAEEDPVESSLESKIAGLYLALAQDTGLSWALPFEGAVVGISFIGAT